MAEILLKAHNQSKARIAKRDAEQSNNKQQPPVLTVEGLVDDLGQEYEERIKKMIGQQRINAWKWWRHFWPVWISYV